MGLLLLLLLIGLCAPALAIGVMLVRKESSILRALGLMAIGISGSGLAFASISFAGLILFG